MLNVTKGQEMNDILNNSANDNHDSNYYDKFDDGNLQNIFMQKVHFGDPEYVRDFLKNSNVIERIPQSCMFIGLIYAATGKNLEIFNILHDQMKKDGVEISNELYKKLFNSLCYEKYFNNLKTLDKKIKLSQLMMLDASSINEKETIEGDKPNVYAKRVINSSTYDERFTNSWNEHGFIIACKDGNRKIVSYLLSASEKIKIPEKLLESGFIWACKTNQQSTALIIYQRLESINNSKFIQDYVASMDKPNCEKTFLKASDDEIAMAFLSKLMLKEKIENQLQKNHNVDKRIKI